jgi:hypothetical protein
MMTQETTARERRAANLAGTYDVRQAERHADALSDLILSGTLSPDGMATAHGARGLLFAVLALRETITDAAADTADAATDLDATLSVIAGAVTGDGEPSAAGPVLILGGAR